MKETRKLILVLLLLTLILPCGFIQAAPGPIKELVVVNEMLTIPRDEMGKYGDVLTAEIGLFRARSSDRVLVPIPGFQAWEE